MTHQETCRKNFTTHGMTGTHFHNIYMGILCRCYTEGSTSYPKYGALGIVCERQTFEEFKDDMYENYLKHIEEFGKKNTTIDRIDSKGNYSKENCRWRTYLQQVRNRKSTIWVLYQGKSMTLKEISILVNIDYKKLRQAMKYYKGLTIEEVIVACSRKKRLYVNYMGINISLKEYSRNIGKPYTSILRHYKLTGFNN